MEMQTLTPAEREKIEEEIRAEVDKVIRGCQTLDLELAFEPFWNDPGFRMMSMNGTLQDYQTYVKDNVDYLGQCERFDLTTLKEEIRVLTAEMAIFSWEYRVRARLKTGGEDVIDQAGASFFFRKLAEGWKVVYYQESTQL